MNKHLLIACITLFTSNLILNMHKNHHSHYTTYVKSQLDRQTAKQKKESERKKREDARISHAPVENNTNPVPDLPALDFSLIAQLAKKIYASDLTDEDTKPAYDHLEATILKKWTATLASQ